MTHGGEEIGLGGIGGKRFVARPDVIGGAVLDLLLQADEVRFQLLVAHPDGVDHGVEAGDQNTEFILAFRLDAAGEIALPRDRLYGAGQVGQRLDHRLLQAARHPKGQSQGDHRQPQYARQRL